MIHFTKKTNKQKFSAFTLAEILVTLTLLGVLSAIIIPSSIHSFQKKVYITKYRKTYAELNTAFENYLLCKNQNICDGFDKVLSTDYQGCNFNAPGGNVYVCMADILSVSLKTNGHVLKYGKYDINDPSRLVTDEEKDAGELEGKKYDEDAIPYNGGKDVKTLDGKETFKPERTGQINMQNGTDINISCGWAHWVKKNGVGVYLCQFYIDVNGEANGPNVMGEDIFYVLALNDGLYTWPVSSEYDGFYIQVAKSLATAKSERNTHCRKTNSSGYACSGWFLDHADYEK